MEPWRRGLHKSMKLWAMPCRAPQDGWVIVESSDKTWSTGGGNGKPLQYSCLENSMDGREGKEIWPFRRYGHLIQRVNSLEKILMLGKIEGKRSGWQRVRWLDNTDLRDMSLSKLWEIVEGQGSRRAAIHVVAKSRTWLNNWTTTKCIYIRATLSIRPTPSFPVSKNLFSASASLFLPCE